MKKLFYCCLAALVSATLAMQAQTNI